ncbi:MAG TPA: hypothetical protein IAA43_00685 [Candidatus Olsenella avicola]|nr:hypothetical protein [Candidatus Olsenella avicola]
MFRQSVRAAWRKLAVGLVAASMLVAPIAAPAAALATGIEDIPVTFLPVGDEDYDDQFVVTVGGSSTSSSSSDYDYADGSAGFFRYIGADAAAAVLEKAPSGSAAGKYYQEAVDNIESTQSPLNLDAMMTSLEIVEDCNALRQRESDCDDLLIDPYLMRSLSSARPGLLMFTATPPLAQTAMLLPMIWASAAKTSPGTASTSTTPSTSGTTRRRACTTRPCATASVIALQR